MPAAKMRNPLQPGPADIPSVDRLLNARAFQQLLAQHGRTQVVAALRTHLDSLRHAALEGALARASLTDEVIAAAVDTTLAEAARPRLRPVFNLTGTVLHTNLGRALVAEEAAAAMRAAMRDAVALEFDIATGRRGERDDHVRALICELTGAEDATIVNNNAAAVLLVLNTLS